MPPSASVVSGTSATTRDIARATGGLDPESADDLNHWLQWMGEGTNLIEDLIGRLTERAATAPSLLPGWSRGHVAAHLAHNADAVANLLVWAATGSERPMYDSQEQREADIDSGACLRIDELAALLYSADQRLEKAVDAMSAHTWVHTVRTSTQRSIPALQAAWLRVREVWVHAIDLDRGVTFDDLPSQLIDALVTDVCQTFAGRSDPPSVSLRSAESDRRWNLSPVETSRVLVTGTVPALAGWVLGRSTGSTLCVEPSGPLPPIGKWL